MKTFYVIRNESRLPTPEELDILMELSPYIEANSAAEAMQIAQEQEEAVLRELHSQAPKSVVRRRVVRRRVVRKKVVRKKVVGDV